MSTADLITTDLVALDVDFGRTPAEVIPQLAGLVGDAGRATDPSQLTAAALAREEKAGTGVPGGVAIPHCRSEAVEVPTLAFARLSNPVDFAGPDRDANLVFLIAAPAGGGKAHLTILSKLARALVRKEFLEALREAGSAEEVVKLVREVVEPDRAAASAPAAKTEEAAPAESTPSATAAEGAAAAAPVQQPAAPTRILAITACPTGIAHTYMAADALAQAAAERPDIELTLETQGSSATEPASAEVIAAADAVIFATDIGVRDRDRFAGKPVIESGVKRAINEPAVMLDEAAEAARNPYARRVGGAADDTAGAVAEEARSTGSSGLGWGKRIQQAVMTGVSYMVPFVAAGGLLIAIGFLLGGEQIGNHWQAIVTQFSLNDLPVRQMFVNGVPVEFERSGFALYIAAVIFATGQMAMGFVVAALSGYIAYALANRPGIAPGFVGGAISVAVGAGFLGGLLTGIVAGLVAMWIGSIKVPRWLASLMPVVIIPLVTSLVVGLLMFLFLGRPLALAMTSMQEWLASMSGSSAVLLGVILGLMMCFDLGGPVNKAAYLFATAGLSTGDEASMMIMAAVMGAGMVPPIALSLATVLRRNLFTPAEQENGKSSWLLGLSFVSEGALPFAATDPLRVIPAMMAGGAITGAISMGLEVGTGSPHGGIFVIAAVSPALAWLAAVAAGVVTSAMAVIALKELWPNKTVEASAANAEAAEAEADAAELDATEADAPVQTTA